MVPAPVDGVPSTWLGKRRSSRAAMPQRGRQGITSTT